MIKSGVFQPAEHRPKSFPNLFDWVLGIAIADLFHFRFSGIALRNEVPCEGAVLDVREHTLHFGFGVGRNQPWSAHVVAVFRGVGDGISHGSETAFHHQVDNQLHFMHALEVSQFRLISRFDQRFKASLDKL